MADLYDIPDEAWIDVVAAVGWDESNELWPVLQKALAAALPVVTADLVAEIQQKDTELDEWRNGTRRLPIDDEIREATAAELESIADDDTGWAIGGYLRKRAASLRGEQGE